MYEVHEAANLFPMMNDVESQELAADIKSNGLREPVVLLDSKILDGRNRHAACLLAQAKLATRVVETDDPIGYVLSLNLHRRQLNQSQRAMTGARIRPHF